MDWEQIVSAAAFLLQLLAGGGSTYLIDWLKTTLKLQGNWALVATAVVATVIAVLSLIVEGQLTAETANWESFPTVFGVVFIASQARFRMLRDREMGKQVAQVRYEAAVAQQLAGDAIAEAQGTNTAVIRPDKELPSTWGYGGDGR